ncbi:unnamed protein product [Closterium sp. NIES-54]
MQPRRPSLLACYCCCRHCLLATAAAVTACLLLLLPSLLACYCCCCHCLLATAAAVTACLLLLLPSLLACYCCCRHCLLATAAAVTACLLLLLPSLLACYCCCRHCLLATAAAVTACLLLLLPSLLDCYCCCRHCLIATAAAAAAAALLSLLATAASASFLPPLPRPLIRDPLRSFGTANNMHNLCAVLQPGGRLANMHHFPPGHTSPSPSSPPLASPRSPTYQPISPSSRCHAFVPQPEAFPRSKVEGAHQPISPSPPSSPPPPPLPPYPSLSHRPSPPSWHFFTHVFFQVQVEHRVLNNNQDKSRGSKKNRNQMELYYSNLRNWARAAIVSRTDADGPWWNEAGNAWAFSSSNVVFITPTDFSPVSLSTPSPPSTSFPAVTLVDSPSSSAHNPSDLSLVILDATLCDALYKGAIKKGLPYPTECLKRDVGPLLLRRMQAQHKVEKGGRSVERKGEVEPVQIFVRGRQGSRNVTRVTGVEAYLVEAELLAAELREKFASSTSVAEVPGKKGQHEVLLQGGFLDKLSRLLVDAHGIPKSYVAAIDYTRR